MTGPVELERVPVERIAADLERAELGIMQQIERRTPRERVERERVRDRLGQRGRVRVFAGKTIHDGPNGIASRPARRGLHTSLTFRHGAPESRPSRRPSR